MNTFRFIDFPVYKEAKVYYVVILRISENVYAKNRSLSDQVQRAGLSILLNIAEGSAKKSDKDFARFLGISIGSVNEVVSCLDIMKEFSYISNDVYLRLFQKSESIAKQLGGFMKQLSKS